MSETKKVVKKKCFEIQALGEFHLPKRVHKGCAYYGLIIPEDVYIAANSRTRVSLNFSIKIPTGTIGLITPRHTDVISGLYGLGKKQVCKKVMGIFPKKSFVDDTRFFDADVVPTKVDCTFTGNLSIVINNHDEGFFLAAGSRIADLSFVNVVSPFLSVIKPRVEDEVEPTPAPSVSSEKEM